MDYSGKSSTFRRLESRVAAKAYHPQLSSDLPCHDHQVCSSETKPRPGTYNGVSDTLVGHRYGRQGAKEGPERIEVRVFEEEVAVDGIVFDQLFDNVLRFGDAADLAEALRDEPVPIDAEFLEGIGQAFFGHVKDLERGERSVLHIDFEFQRLPVLLAVGFGLHDPLGPHAGLRSVQGIGPSGDEQSFADELAVVVEFFRQAHEKIPSLLVFAFAVEATTLEDGAFHLDGRAAVAADAVQIRHQFSWPRDHEGEK